MLLHVLLDDLRNWRIFLLMILSTLLATLAGRAKDQICGVQSCRVAVMIKAAILQYSLRLSPDARTQYPAGKIINLSTGDVNLLKTYTLKVHDIWTGPIQVAAIFVLVVQLIGLSGISGTSQASPESCPKDSLTLYTRRGSCRNMFLRTASSKYRDAQMYCGVHAIE